jgi:hypothetical protein
MNNRSLSLLLLALLLVILFQSCDFINPYFESKRRQKTLEKRLDSLKIEYAEITNHIDSLENELIRLEMEDSLSWENYNSDTLIRNTLNNAHTTNNGYSK